MKARAVIAASILMLPGATGWAAESISVRLPLPEARAPHKSLAWGRDPFIAPEKGTASKAGGALTLTAVFYGAKSPSAIINDRIVYRGSQVFGQKVIDIGLTHVILQGENGRFRLDLADLPELRNADKKD